MTKKLCMYMTKLKFNIEINQNIYGVNNYKIETCLYAWVNEKENNIKCSFKKKTLLYFPSLKSF